MLETGNETDKYLFKTYRVVRTTYKDNHKDQTKYT